MPPIAITVIAVAVIIVINILVAFEFGEIAVMKGFPEKKRKSFSCAFFFRWQDIFWPVHCRTEIKMAKKD